MSKADGTAGSKKVKLNMDLEGLTYAKDPSGADEADPADSRPQSGKNQKQGMGKGKRPSMSKADTKR